VGARDCRRAGRVQHGEEPGLPAGEHDDDSGAGWHDGCSGGGYKYPVKDVRNVIAHEIAAILVAAFTALVFVQAFKPGSAASSVIDSSLTGTAGLISAVRG
jgi:hypothetical protein